MDNSYRIMQVTETGEEFCIEDGLSIDEAEEWVSSNANLFPECEFKIELVIDDPFYSDEPDELDFS